MSEGSAKDCSIMTKSSSPVIDESVCTNMDSDYFHCSSPLSTTGPDLVDLLHTISSMPENTYLSSDWEDICFDQSSDQEQNFVSASTSTRSSVVGKLRERAASASAAMDSTRGFVASECYSPKSSNTTLRLPAAEIDHKNVWNSQINWSRSTVELSSDEESLPSSTSCSEISELGLQGLDDANHQAFEIVSLNSHTLPPFRSRAYTAEADIGTWRQTHARQQQHQQRRQNHHADVDVTRTDRGIEHHSADFRSSRYQSSSSNERRNNKQRMTPGRGIMFLFLIATYTTFWLPYPEFPDVERVEDMLFLNPSHPVNNDITNLSNTNVSSNTIRVTNKESVSDQRHASASMNTFGTRGGGAAFARRNNNLKQFRTEEMKLFLQQRAIRQHYQSMTWFPWHVNVTILVSVALWSVVDWARKRRSVQTI